MDSQVTAPSFLLSPFFLHLASFSPLALRALSLIHRALLVDGFVRESYEYMYARPWSRVVDFYAELVRAGAGAAGLAKLFGKDEVRKKNCHCHQPPYDRQVVIFLTFSIGMKEEKCRFFLTIIYIVPNCNIVQ